MDDLRDSITNLNEQMTALLAAIQPLLAGVAAPPGAAPVPAAAAAPAAVAFALSWHHKPGPADRLFHPDRPEPV